MSDLKLQPIEGGLFGLFLADGDIALDNGLETAVILSLFCDARAEPSELPPGVSDRRGWCADALNEDGDRIGSKLWLLSREKVIPETIRRAREYCEQALAWMVKDGVASAVKVESERYGLEGIAVEVDVYKPDGSSARFDYVWSAIGVARRIAA